MSMPTLNERIVLAGEDGEGMLPAEAVRLILKNEKRSMRSMAMELDITPQGLSNRLAGDMKVSSLCQMAEALGYRVVLDPREVGSNGIELKA